MRISWILILGFALLTLPGFAVAPVRIELELEATATLPGIPVGMTVRVTNTTDHSLDLPEYLSMVAVDAAGQRHVLHATSRDMQAIALNADDQRLGPQETRRFDYDVPPTVIGIPWLLDPSVSRPGEYKLSASLVDAVDREPATQYISNEIPLLVRTVSDEDVAVWRWMEERGKGAWGQDQWMQHVDALARYVRQEHPRSGYAPYLVLYSDHGSPAEARLAIRQAIRDFPSSPILDQLKLYLAKTDLSSVTYYRQGDEAQSAAERARVLLSDLSERAKREGVREEARALLARVPSRESLERKK